MTCEKITFLPPCDPELDRELLNELIHEELKVLMLVLGSSDDARILAERGNKSAGAINEPFWVVWIRAPEAVDDVLAGLQDPRGLLVEGALGIVLTFNDEIHTVFTSLPSSLKILSAFVNAGKL